MKQTYEEMTKAVKGKSLEWLKDQKLMNSMNDHWKAEDFMWDSVLFDAILEIKEMQKHENI